MINAISIQIGIGSQSFAQGIVKDFDERCRADGMTIVSSNCLVSEINRFESANGSFAEQTIDNFNARCLADSMTINASECAVNEINRFEA